MKELPKPPEGYKLSFGCSAEHLHLLQIALGLREVVQVKKLKPLEETLDVNKLHLLQHMLELEFAGSLDQEIQKNAAPADDAAQPRAYDIYLMIPSSPCAFVQGRDGIKLAAVMPLFLKNAPSPPMMWCDWEGFWNLEPRSHIRRVASLTGMARIFQALRCSEPPPLMEWAMSRQMIVDSVVGKKLKRFIRDHPDLVSSMNDSQVQALATVANSKFQQGFFALQGPPGCGKTHTIIGMISAIGEGMIVTAPSNPAVANIALKLFETGKYSLSEVVVFGEGCAESVRFLNPKVRSAKYSDLVCRLKDARGDDKQLSLLKEFASWLHLKDLNNISVTQIGKLCPYFNMEKFEDRMRLKRLYKSSKVIFCTLNTSGSASLRGAVAKTKFSTFLLDEGGQCSEAEFYISTTFPGITRIIVVGDPKQLPATVVEPVCKNAGFGNSWLGQVYKLLPDKVHLLDTQYRMHPSILAFPNSQFYSHRIHSGANVSLRLPRISNPFQFVDTSDGGMEEVDDLSWKNQFEADVIKFVLQHDEDIIRIRTEVAKPRTIVITPYSAQVKVLLATLATATGLGHVDVATVDSFQGQEGDIVVVSTVRTRSVGFTDDPQRLNVAITRAKRVLRVVGSLNFFLSLTRSNSTLKALASKSLVLGLVVKKDGGQLKKSLGHLKKDAGQVARDKFDRLVQVVKDNVDLLVQVPKGGPSRKEGRCPSRPNCEEGCFFSGPRDDDGIPGQVAKKDVVFLCYDDDGIPGQLVKDDDGIPGQVAKVDVDDVGVPSPVAKVDVGIQGLVAKNDVGMNGHGAKVDVGIAGQAAKNDVGIPGRGAKVGKPGGVEKKDVDIWGQFAKILVDVFPRHWHHR